MLISFFLQTITQANENHYRSRKSMFKVSNNITEKGVEPAILNSS